MSDLDDQILRDKLQHLGGRLPDERAAYAELQARVRSAKRRRAMVGSSGLALACVVALVVANFGGRDHQSVTTATDDVTAPEVTEAVATSTTIAAQTTTTSTELETTTTSTTIAADTTVMETVAPPAVAPVESATTVKTSTGKGTGPKTSNPAPPPTQPPVTAPDNSAPDNSGPPDTEPSTPTTAKPTTETRTFTANHGSITVRLRDGQLELVDHQSAPGYDFRVDRSDGQRIKVRFRNDQETSQIDVSVDNGHIRGTIDEQLSGTGDTASPTTEDHSGSGGFGGGFGGWDSGPESGDMTGTSTHG